MITLKDLIESGCDVAYCKWCSSIVYKDDVGEYWRFFCWLDDQAIKTEDKAIIDALPDVNCGCNGLY